MWHASKLVQDVDRRLIGLTGTCDLLSPAAVRLELFAQWLEQHYPEHKDKVLGRVRGLRGGKLNEADFGKRMRGQGPLADMIQQLFNSTCRRLGINGEKLEMSTAAFRRPEERTLFD